MGGEGLEKHNHLYVAWFTCHTLHEVSDTLAIHS